jgi:hypothetical protein
MVRDRRVSNLPQTMIRDEIAELTEITITIWSKR